MDGLIISVNRGRFILLRFEAYLISSVNLHEDGLLNAVVESTVPWSPGEQAGHQGPRLLAIFPGRQAACAMR